ncbi:MAG: hypothetical protein QXR53_03305 [Candidatus Norongarragalinales archaeon]
MRKTVFVLLLFTAFFSSLIYAQTSLVRLPPDAVGIFLGFKVDVPKDSVDVGGKTMQEVSVATGKSETELSKTSRQAGGDGYTFPYGSYVRSSGRSIILAQGAKPSLSPEQIERILCHYKSPLCGFRDKPSGKSAAQLIYEKSDKYRIDDWFAMAIGLKESGLLKARGYMQHLAWGNIVYNAPGKQFCSFRRSNGHCGYDSFENSIEHFFYYMTHSRHYLPRGRDTPEEIMPIYAPSYENDTQGYIAQINRCRETWIAGGTNCWA